MVGWNTHTIFPLSAEKALILTNLSWARNPFGNPLRERPNPELFRGALFNWTDVQIGRQLNETEVAAINYIIKMRAHRYIAAAEEEWLYPEKVIGRERWDRLTEPHLLMPDPRSMNFSSEVLIGYKDGSSDAFDKYGRKPWQDNYRDQARHDYEWHTFHAFQGEYARLFGPKRRGVASTAGTLDSDEDSDDYHRCLLSLESEHKPLIRGRSSKKGRRKGKRR